MGNSLFVSCLVANSHPSFFPTLLQHCHAPSPMAGRDVKGLTPIALSWKKDTHFTETSVVNFPVCVFVRRANFNFVFGDTIFQTSRFHGAMCFASVSIFGNKTGGSLQ